MKRCAIVLLLATACTHHSKVTTLRPQAPGVEAMASLANGSKVEVLATTTPDGLRWVTNSTEPHQIIDPVDMRSYTTQRPGLAVVEGLAIGAVSGAAIGALWGFADSSCPKDAFCIISPGMAAGYGAIALGSLGLVAGALSGLIAGNRNVHEIETERMPRVSATVGNGGAAAVMSWSY